MYLKLLAISWLLQVSGILIWHNLTDDHANQNGFHRLNYQNGADHRNFCIAKVRGLVWVKQNLVMSRGPGSLASAGVGGLWFWLSQRERERKRE